MTEQKNSSEKTEKTDKSDKASAPKKHSIEPKSARGASTTARRKTAKEADDALQAKIEKARAGAMPERREPAAAGESAGLPPVQTVRAMPQINRKKDETTSDEKAVAKKPSAPVKMPERDATGRFLPSEERAKKPRAKARAQQARTEDVKKPSEKPEAKPAQKTAQKSEPKETQKAPKQVEPKVETKTERQPAQKTQEAKAAKKPEGPVTSAAPAAPVPIWSGWPNRLSIRPCSPAWRAATSWSSTSGSAARGFRWPQRSAAVRPSTPRRRGSCCCPSCRMPRCAI